MITLNTNQRTYIIPCGEGYSCLGFDYAFECASQIAGELSLPHPKPSKIGSLDGYNEYLSYIDAAKSSEKQLTCGLTRQLVGLEGQRVEVVTVYGER